MKNNSNNKNIALNEKGYEEIAFSCSDLDFFEDDYNNSCVNFFGISSGLRYENLSTTTSGK